MRNMYDILREAASAMKSGGTECIECDCEVHGQFKVFKRG